MNYKIIALALGAAIVGGVIGALLVGGKTASDELTKFGATLGITRYPNSGLAARFLTISTTAGTATAGTDGALNIGGGTSITKFSCASTSFNPGSLTTSTITNATSTDIALSGAVVGDVCTASLTSATTTLVGVNCVVSATATGTIQLVNFGSVAIDLATGTAKVCYTH